MINCKKNNKAEMTRTLKTSFHYEGKLKGEMQYTFWIDDGEEFATIDYLHTTLYDTQGGVEYTILGSFFGQAIETLRVTVGGTGGKGAAEALHISVYVQSMFRYKFRAHTDFLLLEPPCRMPVPKVRQRQPSSIHYTPG